MLCLRALVTAFDVCLLPVGGPQRCAKFGTEALLVKARGFLVNIILSVLWKASNSLAFGQAHMPVTPTKTRAKHGCRCNSVYHEVRGNSERKSSILSRTGSLRHMIQLTRLSLKAFLKTSRRRRFFQDSRP